jgi:mRNA-degrading endonuclease RelE of RelBE toxin-antitoxin system
MATVVITPEAAEQLDELPMLIHARMIKVLERLEKWPAVSGAKPLAGRLAGHYRIRTGDYRMQFRAKGDEVIVEKIGHRDGFYED